MAEYWLVSVPGDDTPKQAWEFIDEKTKSISANHKFHIPDLKVLKFNMLGLIGSGSGSVAIRSIPMIAFFSKF